MTIGSILKIGDGGFDQIEYMSRVIQNRRFEAFRGAVLMAVFILFCNPKRMTKRHFNSDLVSRVSFRVKIEAPHYPQCITDLDRANYGRKCLT